ncbi:MAG TPA: pilus assembly protein N-terminal domain-containing protein [Kofleriaceae bacterium]|nr:pilus assembly protein N-terminal domain-containing protein [Kofleriaceae bacterium]
MAAGRRAARVLRALLPVALAVLAGRPAHAQEGTKKEIVLVVGEQTSISAKNVRTYSEGVPGIIDVRVPKDGSEFVIVALKPGTTSLLLIYEDGTKAQYGFKVVTARTAEQGGVNEKENIRLDFYFVELSENYNHQIGVGFPATIGGDNVFRANAVIDLKNTELLTATAVISNQPLPRLDILQSSGWVRISRQAVLVTQNGNQASFSSGGEVNLAINGALTAEIRRIEFGSLIRVLPQYDPRTGRIELTISADVSDLTDDRGSGIPGRTVSKLDTLVNLELGQGVMLAGLNAHTEARTDTGLPLLSQIPVFGYLFGTHGNREEQTRNVLFIVPTVVDVVRADARAHIVDALRIFEEYDGDLEGIDLLQAPKDRGRKRKRKARR